MANSYFEFKQFKVYHDRCAMKVGTDGVLLGAWVRLGEAAHILDIGTGTGLLALMMAQRCADCKAMDAIDIDPDAILQAQDNIEQSVFGNITCHQTSLQDYVQNCGKKYDLIVSNPPYFRASLLSPDEQRSTARHTHRLSIDDFMRCSVQLLSPEGRLSLIFPYSDKDLIIEQALKLGLFLSRITTVHTTPTAQPKRVLLEFSVIEEALEQDALVIEKARHVYSHEFASLVKDFYLKM